MRLDKYLKVSRLIKRRTVANEACDGGRVTVSAADLVAGGILPEGGYIGADEAGLYHLIKTAKLTETAANKLKQTGNSVKLMFKMDMKPDDFLMVMRYVDGEWVVMEAEKVEILEDGSVTVQFDEEVGTIAFVVQKSEEIKK